MGAQHDRLEGGVAARATAHQVGRGIDADGEVRLAHPSERRFAALAIELGVGYAAHPALGVFPEFGERGEVLVDARTVHPERCLARGAVREGERRRSAKETPVEIASVHESSAISYQPSAAAIG